MRGSGPDLLGTFKSACIFTVELADTAQHLINYGESKIFSVFQVQN